MKKAIFLLCFLLVSTSVLARRQVEITFWHSLGFHIKEIIEDMADEYSKNNRGVKINPVFQGLYWEMQVKMIAAAITRQLPDVAQVQIEYLNSYIENGVLEPIDGEIAPEDREDILDVMWELVQKDGKTYAVPFTVSTTVLFYNEQSFREAGLDPERPPRTWEELVEYGKKLTVDTDGDGDFDKYATMFWLRGLYGIAPFLWANGGTLFSEDGKRIDLTSREMLKTIEMIRDLVFTHRIMPQTWTDWEGGQAFLSGNLAMGAFTSAAITYGMQNFPWTLRVAPMPAINGRRYTVIGGAGLVNFASNRRKRRIINDFIHWMTNRENTIRLHENVGYIPVRQSAIDSLSLRAFHRNNPNFKVPIDSLEFGKTFPYHTDFYKINEEIKEMLEQIILNNADPYEQLRKTERTINQLIE